MSVLTLHSFDDNVRILAANLRELHFAHMALSSGVNGSTAPTTNDAVRACCTKPMFRVICKAQNSAGEDLGRRGVGSLPSSGWETQLS